MEANPRVDSHVVAFRAITAARGKGKSWKAVAEEYGFNRDGAQSTGDDMRYYYKWLITAYFPNIIDAQALEHEGITLSLIQGGKTD